MASFVKALDAVWEWNQTVPTAIEDTVANLYEKQARLNPNALAVDAHDGTWTYRELDEVSNSVAQLLIQRDIRREDIVPLCFEKSRWAIVGVLAVLKAGAAFVFIEPSHPEARRKHILSEIQAKLVVCSPSYAELYQVEYPGTVVVSERFLASLGTSLPQNESSPGSLLYVIYTSGSSGVPKGCLIENRAFLSGSLRHGQRGNIGSSTRVLQLASYTFDASVLEILTALIHGACVCTPDMALMANGPAFLVNKYNITWTFMTPSLVKLMTPSMVPTLKTLALGGEPLSKIDIQTWAGHVQLINGYGPSECSVAAVGNTNMTPETDPADIGHPVGGICWIVEPDNHDILLPPGQIGELLIEGPILGRGYLNDAEKTREAFIECPAWGPATADNGNRRCYKTGDLAKFQSDGSIYFVGRKDTQVKLRGLRIELGEIEYNIGTHPRVVHQMVTLPKEGLFANRLVALVSLTGYVENSLDDVSPSNLLHPDLHSETVKELLRSVREGVVSKSPEYMIPEVWIILKRFPMLISSKLNRQLLSTWIREVDTDSYRRIMGIEIEDGSDKPDDNLSRLKAIIAAVLNLPPDTISTRKSFLGLGGDSITALQIKARCRDAGLSVSIKDILRSKDISTLSNCITVTSMPTYTTEEDLDSPFPLSPMQRMCFDLAPEAIEESPEFRLNQSFFLQVGSTVSDLAVATALWLVVSQHSMLRARFFRDGATWLQVIPSKVDGSFSFTSHQVSSTADAYRTMRETQALLNPQKGPVFAAALFDTEAGEQFLFLVGHHLVIDFVSWRIILRDVEEVLTTGVLTALKPMPWKNWLSLQQDQAGAVDVAHVLPYAVPPPHFSYWAMDNRRNCAGEVEEMTFSLDLTRTKALLEGTCHLTYNTEPIDLLLGALIFSFGQNFADRSVPPIFREGHGREPWDDGLDVSETVGWFTTMYPMHVEVKEQMTIFDIVQRAKDVRHSVPDNGRPYFASRYLTEAGAAKFDGHDHVEVSFDYLGLYQQMERAGALLSRVPGYQAIFEDVGSKVPRFQLIEITAEVLQGRMQLQFIYNKHMKWQTRIRSWIQDTERHLIDLVDQLPDRPKAFTLSDFPLLEITYERLNALASIKLPESGIPLAAVESIYPCSPMQQGLLLSQVGDGIQGAYEYAHILKIETRKSQDSIDVKALELAWAAVVQRHTSLRTVFIESSMHNGLYDQVVLKSLDPIIENRQFFRDRGEAEVLQVDSDRLVFRPGAALHRITICQTSHTTALCKLEINHAIVDGLSISSIVKDMLLAYDGLLPDGSGFRFEKYLQHTLKRPVEPSIAFWKEHLAGAAACHFPCMSFWENAAQSVPIYETVAVDLHTPLLDISRLCAENNVTIVNIFQLAWGLVLRKYTSSDDVCFGYLSSGRDAPLRGIEEGVGAFITMLVSRLLLDEETTLSSALNATAENAERLQQHQHCGLAEIHHALGLGNRSLFNTLISFRKESDHEILPHSRIKIESVRGYDPTEYTIVLDVGMTETKLDVSLNFWTSNLTSNQMRNVGAILAEALHAIVRHTQRTVGAIDLVGKSHKDQMRKITLEPHPRVDKCIHDLIMNQAASTPDAEAICSFEGSWTYEKLNDQSERLAKHLQSLGVGPESIVPFVFEKSAWAIVSILAILRAGAACTGLDPAHPVERLEGLMSQTKSKVILTSTRNANILHTSTSRRTVIVSEHLIDNLPQSAGLITTKVLPSNACYVLFTSGTTGIPKGVVIEHRNVSSLLSRAAAGPNWFSSTARVLQFAAYTWDVSVQDILGTLTYGGTLCVISDDERMNDLAAGINRTRATFATMTPTVISMLNPAEVPTIRRLHSGGEPLSRDLVDLWADSVDFYNTAGPTETTITTNISAKLSRGSSAMNIGPANGCRIWIVDVQNHNRLVPMGCPGEILIEGPMVSRGYLHQPDRTADVFIEDPVWMSEFPDRERIAPRRFYKSGDIGCLNTDGSITFVARRDAQVKIHGQRVELDEILNQATRFLPDHYSVAVDAVELKSFKKGKTVVLFIASPAFRKFQEHHEQTTFRMNHSLRSMLRTLQSSLAKVIPLYMIPSLFVPVFSLPRTSHGKLARSALQSIVLDFTKTQISQLMLKSHVVAQPLSQTEEALRSLMSKVLNIDVHEVGREDDFFILGGDSLSAMRMVAASRKYHLGIKVADILQNPILKDLAKVLDDSHLPSSPVHVAPFSLIEDLHREDIMQQSTVQCNLNCEDVEDIYPASPLQEGMMALGRKHAGAYVSQKVFTLPSHLQIAKFQSAWNQATATEAIFRTRIVSTDYGTFQVVPRSPTPWMQATDLESVLQDDPSLCFDYGKPLMRMAITSSRHFVWLAHHAIFDAWTTTTLFEKVAQAYSGEQIAISPPFRNFISKIHSVPEGESVAFWKSQFADTDGSPIGFPRVEAGYTGVPKTRTSIQIKAPAKLPAILPSTVIMVAWALTLASFADSDDVVFAQTLSGRNVDVEGIDTILGPTITTTPIRLSVPRDGITVEQFLKETQDRSVASIDHEHFGLQNIRSVSKAARLAVDNIASLFAIQPYMTRDNSILDLGDLPDQEENFHTYPLVVLCQMGKDDDFVLEAMHDELIITSHLMMRMLRQCEHLIQQLSNHIQRPMDRIQLVNRHDLEDIVGWNAGLPTAVHATIPDMIARTIEERPDAEALCAWDGNLTYSQLDLVTSKLASHLISLGVGPEVKVALCFDRSIWNAVAIVAVMRAGGCCVQILPGYPDSRRAAMLEDIKTSVVIVSPAYGTLFRGMIQHILPLNHAFIDGLPSHCKSLHPPQCSPSNSAIIVFTSGSTGRPKGIVLEHGAFCTTARYSGSFLELSSNSRVFQFASHAFDASFFEILVPLTVGGCVCIPSEHDKMNDLVAAINSSQANWIQLCPSVADIIQPDQVPSLKIVSLGGEQLGSNIQARWVAHKRLYQVYGPGECTVMCVMTRMHPDTPSSMIGKPVACRTWVVEPSNSNRLVPIGCVGELVVEGPLVGREYLNNPTKTDEAFIENPEWASQIRGGTSRMYKTGDLVRYLPGGNLEILGRKDTQIKIHGVRVELGEIEYHAATSSIGARSIAVEYTFLKERDTSRPVLSLFIVVNEAEIVGDISHIPMSEEIRKKLLEVKRHIAQHLQRHMVPILYIPLHKMPRTATDKIDRTKLRRIGADLSAEQLKSYSLPEETDEDPSRPPSTPMEIILQHIWAKALELDPTLITANDNFLDRGGDSLAAMRVSSLARKSGVQLIVADIFKNPILHNMASIAVKVIEDTVKDISPFSLAPSDDNLIGDAARQCGVSIGNIEDIYPCTTLQEGLLELTTQRKGAYTAQRVYRFTSDIDVDRFKTAWNHVVASNPILRTRIVLSKRSGAFQVVLKTGTTWEHESTLEKYLDNEKERSIDYGSALTRFGLDIEHRHFIWTVHHALYDGYSINLIMTQLEDLYAGASNYVPPGFNHFIDYLSNVDVAENAAFWRKQITGPASSFPSLPTATYQPSPNSVISRVLPISRVKGTGIMLSTTLHAAWAIVTSRYMGSEDVIFAATRSGRDTPIQNIDKIVGPTITTVPIQLRVAPTVGVVTFLKTVQQQSVDMRPFEQAGLQKIYTMTGEKSNPRNLFVIQQELGASGELSLMKEIVDKALLRDFHTYAVVVSCVVLHDSSVRIELQFDDNAVTKGLGQVIIDQFEHVVGQLLRAEPHTCLQDIDLVPTAHHHRMVEWNSLVAVEDATECVHQAFQSQVKIRPDAVAVTSWDGEVTYRGLDDLSNKLACFLIQRGITHGTLLPMCFDKSLYTVVAMMAVLKAGGACVHLGNRTPHARMSDIIDQTGSYIVLTDKNNRSKFSAPRKAITVDQLLLDSLTIRGPLPTISPADPAFVQFTSGSTGKPKGVIIEHASLGTISKAHGVARGIGPSARVLQFAAYTFDVAISDIFTTLRLGGCVCIPSEDERLNDLAGAINRMNCDYANVTPTVANMLEPNTVKCLERLVLGGELVTQDAVKRWSSHLQLILSYGVTECSVHSVSTPLMMGSDPTRFGRPLGCHMWIVDAQDHNKLAPIGHVGELVIEGRAVSRGYLHDDVRTDASFIYDPSWTGSTHKSRRMYKTGDLCRHGPDGAIYFIGRKDSQVKHHGQRIELGDIEHHLGKDARVQQAAVLLPKAGYFQKKIVAVISLRETAKHSKPQKELSLVAGFEKGIADVSVAAVRTRLATRLPEYMIPAVWITVHALPLSSNSKIDRIKTLEWLGNLDADEYKTIVGDAERYGAPATRQQQDIHDMLSQLLCLAHVDMNKSFLELGGDSIVAMQLRAQGRALGFSLTVREIITCDSVSALALPSAGSNVIDSNVAYTLTTWQKVLIQQQIDGQVTLLPVAVPISLSSLPRAMKAIVQRHPLLRTRFSQNSSGQWKLQITNEVAESFQVTAQTVAQNSDIDRFLAGVGSTFNATTGPLISICLFEISQKNTQVIALAMHPLVADSTSFGIVADDLRIVLGGGVLSDDTHTSIRSLFAEEHEHTTQGHIPQKQCLPERLPDTADIGSDLMHEAVHLPPDITSQLLDDANRAFSTDASDILIYSLHTSWALTFGKPPLIAANHRLQHARTVGQLNYIHLLPQMESQESEGIIAEIKDNRVFANCNPSLRQELPDCVDVLVQRMETTSDDLPLKPLQILHPSASITIVPILANGRFSIDFSLRSSIIEETNFSSLVQRFQHSLSNILSTLIQSSPRPTISDLPLLRLTQPQLSHLETFLATINVPYSAVSAIVPCTALQQRMLNAQKTYPTMWRSETACKVNGRSIDALVLKMAWERLVARHESLRTIFIPSFSRRSGFDQLILKEHNPKVNVIQCEAKDLMSAIAESCTFSQLDYTPHVGFTVLHTADEVYFKLEMSHALSDGTSMRILHEELALAYQDLLPKSAAPGFQEYCRWLSKRDLSADHHFWSQYLANLEPCHVPRSTERCGGKIESPKQEKYTLIPVVTNFSMDDLAALCRAYKVTSATLLQTAWAAVLYGITGNEDVCFGYATANRDLDIQGIDAIVGPMINTLPCRIKVTPKSTSAELAKDTAATFMKSLQHQHAAVAMANELETPDSIFPFNSIVSIQYESRLHRAQSGQKEQSKDIAFERVFGSWAPEFDLGLDVVIDGSSLAVNLGYWVGIMDKSTMDRIVAAYGGVMDEWVHGQSLDTKVGNVSSLRELKNNI